MERTQLSKVVFKKPLFFLVFYILFFISRVLLCISCIGGLKKKRVVYFLFNCWLRVLSDKVPRLVTKFGASTPGVSLPMEHQWSMNPTDLQDGVSHTKRASPLEKVRLSSRATC